jgi:hypothetical protein
MRSIRRNFWCGFRRRWTPSARPNVRVSGAIVCVLSYHLVHCECCEAGISASERDLRSPLRIQNGLCEASVHSQFGRDRITGCRNKQVCDTGPRGAPRDQPSSRQTLGRVRSRFAVAGRTHLPHRQRHNRDRTGHRQTDPAAHREEAVAFLSALKAGELSVSRHRFHNTATGRQSPTGREGGSVRISTCDGPIRLPLLPGPCRFVQLHAHSIGLEIGLKREHHTSAAVLSERPLTRCPLAWTVLRVAVHRPGGGRSTGRRRSACPAPLTAARDATRRIDERHTRR